MRVTMFVASAAIAAAGLFAAGCGDDEPSAATETGITKAEWIARADAICARSDALFETAGQERLGGLAPGSPAFERAVRDLMREVVVPGLDEQIDEIAALGVPAGDEERIARVLASARSAMEEVRAEPVILTGPDNPLAEASGLIADYGARMCGD